MPKKIKCRKRWRGGLKETIELMLIRPPQLQFFFFTMVLFDFAEILTRCSWIDKE